MKKLRGSLMILLLSVLLLFAAASLAQASGVTPSPSVSPAVGNTARLSASGTQVTGVDSYTVFADAPGADEAFLYRKAENQSGWVAARFDSSMVDWSYTDYTVPLETTITYRLVARYGSATVESDPLVIHVVLPYGQLAQPAVQAPHQTDLGQPIEILVGEVTHAEQYSVQVYGQSYELVYSNSFTAADVSGGVLPKITLSSSVLTQEGTYHLIVGVSGKGAGNSTADVLFHVGAIAAKASLTPSQTQAGINEWIQFEINAPFADVVKLWSQRSGEEPQLLMTDYGGKRETMEQAWEEPGVYTVTLEVAVDHKTVEESVTVQIISRGVLDRPLITLLSPPAVGQDVTFEVSPVGNAQEYRIEVELLRRSDGGTYYNQSYSQPGVYTLPAAGLPEGGYCIRAVALANGFYSGSSLRYFRLGQADRTVAISADKTQIQTNEVTEITFSAPDALSVDVFSIDPAMRQETYLQWEGGLTENSGTWLFSADAPGSYLCQISAVFEEGAQPVTRSVTVTVVQPADKLAAPRISVPKQVFPGENVKVSVMPDPLAEHYRIHVRNADSGQVIQDYPEQTVDQLIVWKDWLPVKGTYIVEITAFAKGYETSDPASAVFRVSNALPDLSMLTALYLPNELKTIAAEAFQGVSADRVVLPNGVAIIESRAFANASELLYINLPDSLVSIASDAFEGSGILYIECRAGSLAESYAKAYGIETVLK